MTNFEKLKTMSFYEMLNFIDSNCGCGVCSRKDCDNCNESGDCRDHMKEWLESEAEDT